MKCLSLLLFIGLAWGHNSSFYAPEINLLGFEFSTWYVMGWLNIFLGKIAILYFGYKKGWDFSKWLTLVLFATIGAAISTLFLPTIVGTLIGFLGCLILGKKFLGFKHDIGIVIALFIAILFAIGRVGCLLNGCCFGSITTLPWGINYPIGTPAHWLHLFADLIPNTHLSSLSIHPIQLYETIFHILSILLIIKLGKRFKNSNTILLFYFGSYLTFRIFIEFIRDMNNVWWSALSFGPLSLFQWFLFSIVLGLIICALRLEKNHKPVLRKGKTNHRIENNFIIILFCFIVTLIFKDQIQTIHLVQLVILLPMSTFIHLLELRKRYTFFNPISRYVTASMCALLFSTPIISQIESRLDNNPLLNTKLQKPNKEWVYTINENNNTLLRIGNKDITFDEFNRRKKMLNLFSNQTSDSINIYDEIKNNNKSGIQYYGAIGGGYQYHESKFCGSSTMHTVYSIGGTIGKEKKEVKSKSIIYSGYRGNIYLSSYSSDRYDRSLRIENYEHWFNPLFSLHSYKNIDLRLVGFGLGLSGVIARKFTMPDDCCIGKILFIYPNTHIRLGPKSFNLQAGISDRYHNIHNPIVAHLSLGFKNNLRIGVTNQSPDFPLMTPGFFLSKNNNYFMLGPTGFSYGLKFSFLDFNNLKLKRTLF